MLKEGKADFAAASFSQTKARSEVVDYLSLHMGEYKQIYIRNPAEEYDWEVYVLPLSRNSWLSILSFCIILPVVMAVLTLDGKYEAKRIRRKYNITKT